MSNTERTPMSDERKQAIRLGKLKADAKMRAAKHWSIVDRVEGIEQRLPQALRSNSIIKRLTGYVYTDQLKWKLNDDGSPMTIDDEIAFCKRREIPLKKAHYEHLGLEPPTKGAKSTETKTVSAAELAALKPYVTAEEYEALAAAAKAGEEQAQAA